MIVNNLAKEILFSPISDGADTINIVSGHATPTMASWYLTTLQEMRRESLIPALHVNLFVGMTSIEGIHSSWHMQFQRLQQHIDFESTDIFSCSYVCEIPAVRSNLYLWEKDGRPVTAFTGSAPFSQSAFLPSHVEDLMEHLDLNASLNYFNTVSNRSIFCTHAEIEDHVRITNDDFSLKDADEQNNLEKVTLSLLTKNGTIGRKSGLNWGQRDNRNPNEAYIPVPVEIARSGFFPNGKQQFTVQTDDHKYLILRLEQAKDKALTTPLSNSRLGEYFRGRLGLRNGEFVDEDALYRYGRTDVLFEKIDDEQFYMDFAQPGK